MKTCVREIACVHNSLKGKNRDRNKDGILDVQEELYSIVGVFDGVSSAADAKKGVLFAINYIKKRHSLYFKNEDFFLSDLMRDLNESLIQSGIDEPYTTYAVAYISKDSSRNILLSSLGDSRIYAVTNQYVSQISFYKNDHIHSNILTKYLGNKNLISSDFNERAHDKSGESLIICTDGFYAVMESSHTGLSEAHRVMNLKKKSSIKNGLTCLVKGLNDDDASYVFVRWNNVCD